MVDEPELELEEDVLLDEREVVEDFLVDLRLAELTVPLVPEELLPTEPVGVRLTTEVEFAPAGMTAAAA